MTRLNVDLPFSRGDQAGRGAVGTRRASAAAGLPSYAPAPPRRSSGVAGDQASEHELWLGAPSVGPGGSAVASRPEERLSEQHLRSARDKAAVRVLLCEDHPIYLAGLRALLGSEPGLTVVGELDTVEAACLYADRAISDVVVVRQGLLQDSDYEPLRRLCARGAAVLVLAESESRLELLRALRNGARGYLSRRLTGWQLLDGIRALARDEPAFDTVVARHLVTYLIDDPRDAGREGLPATPLDQLTDRQRAVATLVAEGLTNSEIASRLHVSQATVKSHLAMVMRRLDIRSRTQLAILLNRKNESTN